MVLLLEDVKKKNCIYFASPNSLLASNAHELAPDISGRFPYTDPFRRDMQSHVHAPTHTHKSV